jgi:hypothetical protein
MLISQFSFGHHCLNLSLSILANDFIFTHFLRTVISFLSSLHYDTTQALVAQHETLMNALVNSLKTFAASSLPACIRIASIFERMSYFWYFADVLQRFKIGAMTLSLLPAQVALKNVADRNLGKEKPAAYLKNRTCSCGSSCRWIALQPLREPQHDAEDGQGHRHSFGRSPRAAQSRAPHHQSRFLCKIAMVPVNWSAVPYDQIGVFAAQITKWRQANAQNGRHKRITAVRQAIELLCAFSFHPEATDCIRQSGAIVEAAQLSEVGELHSPLIKLISNARATREGFSGVRS